MPRHLTFRTEGLEPRGLLTAGVPGGLNVLEDLGEVSRALAIKGVEVTAPIPSHTSITFKFGAEAAGDYLLKVRYVGEGLTLEAQGPSGSASITPGPPGPFATVALPLQAATYEITASATGDQDVFVDWELLLNSGVGQAASQASTLVVASTSIPLPPSPGPASPSPSPSSTAPSADWTPAVSPSMVAVGGLVGRVEPGQAITPVGPTGPDGEVALASAGDGIPDGILSSLASAASLAEVPTSGDLSTPTTPLLTLEMLGDARPDLEALAVPSWLNRLAEWQGPAAGPGESDASGTPADGEGVVTGTGLAVAIADDAFDAESPGRATLAASPGLVAGAVIVAAAGRRWRPGFRRLTKRRSPRSTDISLPKSMVR